jgi:cytochrome oxidase Cu insertion factor (SCO1/SenC/PrrC family)
MTTSANRPARAAVAIGLLLVAALVGVIWLATATLQRAEAPLPVLAEVPEFSLTEASGEQVALADLRGKPWVADLIFTSCAGVCPRMTKEMATLRKSVADVPGVRFVSFSVDPATDTPEVLRAYAARFTDDRSGWLFLTGDDATIRRVAAEGFLLPVQDGDTARGDEAVLHSSRFVLVDAAGRVRGTYEVNDPEAMLALRGDLRRLRDEVQG